MTPSRNIGRGTKNGEVDHTAIRKAVLEAIEAGDTWSGIALRAGWPDHRRPTSGDVTTLKRRLGMVPNTGHWKKTTKRMAYATAVRIAEAIDRDPVDLGL